MSQYIVSVIRTWVPIIVGWLLSQLVVFGVVFDEPDSKKLATALTALVIAIYYALARWLETKFPNAGALLGFIRQPVYVDPKKTPAEQVAKVDAAVVEAAKSPGT